MAQFISIHALLAESDYHNCMLQIRAHDFYPRSPCGERHLPEWWTVQRILHFYPRSPCGERPISRFSWCKDDHFYPRSPCGERLNAAIRELGKSGISIHALLAESDPSIVVTIPHCSDFYPRSPCGERPITGGAGTTTLRFLSTLSLRRATTSLVVIGTNCVISIHALLAESDHVNAADFHFCGISIHALLAESDGKQPKKARQRRFYFYPRSPCGERRCAGRLQSGWTDISIHALLAESDRPLWLQSRLAAISIHALLAESD